MFKSNFLFFGQSLLPLNYLALFIVLCNFNYFLKDSIVIARSNTFLFKQFSENKISQMNRFMLKEKKAPLNVYSSFIKTFFYFNLTVVSFSTSIPYKIDKKAIKFTNLYFVASKFNQKNNFFYLPILFWFFKKSKSSFMKIKEHLYNQYLYLDENWNGIKSKFKRRLRLKKLTLDLKIRHKKRKKIVKKLKRKNLKKLLKLKDTFYKIYSTQSPWRLKTPEQLIFFYRSCFFSRILKILLKKQLNQPAAIAMFSLKKIKKLKSLKIKVKLIEKRVKRKRYKIFVKVLNLKKLPNKNISFKQKKLKIVYLNKKKLILKKIKIKKVSKFKTIITKKNFFQKLFFASIKKVFFLKKPILTMHLNTRYKYRFDLTKILYSFNPASKISSFFYPRGLKKRRNFFLKKKNKLPRFFKKINFSEFRLKKKNYWLFKKFLKKQKVTASNNFNYKNILNKNSNIFTVSLKSNVIKQFCYIYFQKKTNQLYAKYFLIFFSGFFESFFKKKVFLTWTSNKKFNHSCNWLIDFLSIKFGFLRLKISSSLFLKEMLPILFYSFWFKDLLYFNTWLKYNLERFPLKKHKTFIFYLKLILNMYFALFKKFFKIKGFYLDLRGKVSVAGNAKKRHTSIVLGELTKSNRSLKFDWKQNIIHTNTGVLGLTLIITY